MRTDLPQVELTGTGITTTALGFGCSRLLGPQRYEDAMAVLDAAWASGIRHFDVARSYGSGDVEGLVGDFARRVGRDQVTLTSKFGIQPLRIVAGGRVLVRGARQVMRLSPRLRRALGRQGARLVRTAAFSVPDARASLDTSLRELQTDHLDVLLLHDASPQDCESEELHEFLAGAVESGRIRAFGVGTDIDSLVAICDRHPSFAWVVQLAHGVLAPARDRVVPVAPGGIVTHGAFAGADRIHRHLSGNQAELESWSRALDVDCGDPGTIARLLLAYARRGPGRGPVIFSSLSARHIGANADVVRDPPFSPAQLDALERLAAPLRGPA